MAAYEVLLLNTAIPQIQAAQTGDTYVVPRDIAFSAALTLSAGTANGVPYLNASKVVTTGSALSFDGTNFFGGTNVYASGRFYAQRSSSSLNLAIAGYTDGTAGAILTGNKGDIVAFGNTGGDGVIFANGNTERARITSTGEFQWKPDGTTQAMTLDASGRLLVGTTSAYLSTFKSVVEGATSGSANFALGLLKTGTPQILNGDVLGNIYFYGADNDVTGGNNNLGAQISCVATTDWTTDGTTSNAALVFYTHGTTSGAPEERARITSGGDLLVGSATTATNSSAGFKVLGSLVSGHWDPTVVTDSNSASASCWDIYSTATSSYRFYVTTTGVISAVNTTISAISDVRLKENIQDLDVGLDKIMALKPRKFDWKEGKGKNIKGDRGWIAQEFEQVFPDMIDTWRDPAPEGEEPYKSVRADLIPVMVKAIQELKAEVDSLKAQLEAK